jgi:hypothetical protein
MKSYSREVAATVGIIMLLLVIYTFSIDDPKRIDALTPIVMGFCTPIFLGCLGAFIQRSIQNRIEAMRAKP